MPFSPPPPPPAIVFACLGVSLMWTLFVQPLFKASQTHICPSKEDCVQVWTQTSLRKLVRVTVTRGNMFTLGPFLTPRSQGAKCEETHFPTKKAWRVSQG